MPDERPISPHDDRPCLCVGGRFAGNVARVEFGDGGVEIVEIENDSCHSPFVGVDLDHVDSGDIERIRSLTLARALDTAEHEVRTTGRNNI